MQNQLHQFHQEGFQSGSDEETHLKELSHRPVYVTLQPITVKMLKNKDKFKAHTFLPLPTTLSARLFQPENAQPQQSILKDVQTLQVTKEFRYNKDEIMRSQDPYLLQLFQDYEPSQIRFSCSAPLQLEEIRSHSYKSNTWQVHNSTPFGFNQDFASGNLLRSYYVSANSYDLYLRCDSNSMGHTNWFYFSAGPFRQHQRVTFKVCNFVKQNILFSRGLKPYTKSKDQDWQQGKSIVSCNFSLFKRIKNRKYFCLQFTFKAPQAGCFSFASTPPYTVADLNKDLQQLKSSHKTFQISQIGESVGSLPIKQLTFGRHQKPRWVILITARQHPGETSGSHMLKGFLQYLATNQLHDCLFKVIPMVNPDGVSLGNFRNSYAGVDLNRTFDQSRKLVYPESQAIIKLAKSLKSQYGQKFVMALDFHGHSVRKNVFTFGPPHHNQSVKKLAEYFPAHFAQNCEHFRLKSCHYKISMTKRTTARSFLFKNLRVPFTYTVECSFGLSSKGLLNIPQFNGIGRQAARTALQFLQMLKKQHPMLQLVVAPQDPTESDQFSSEGADSQQSDEDFGQLQQLHNYIEQNKKKMMIMRRRETASCPLDQEIKRIQFPSINKKEKEKINLAQIIIKRPHQMSVKVKPTEIHDQKSSPKRISVIRKSVRYAQIRTQRRRIANERVLEGGSVFMPPFQCVQRK